MSTPEIDERFDDLVRELRTLPGAPDELRTRVLGLAESAPEPAPRWRGSRRPQLRRLALVATCLTLVVIAGVAGIYGLVTSGGPTTNHRERAAATHTMTTGAEVGGPSAALPATPPPPPPTAQAMGKRAPGTFLAPIATVPASDQAHAAAGAAKLPPTQGRLQQYSATMRLRVKIGRAHV